MFQRVRLDEPSRRARSRSACSCGCGPARRQRSRRRWSSGCMADAPDWSFEVQRADGDARATSCASTPIAARRGRHGRRVPAADGGARADRRGLAERDAAHPRVRPAPRQRGDDRATSGTRCSSRWCIMTSLALVVGVVLRRAAAAAAASRRDLTVIPAAVFIASAWRFRSLAIYRPDAALRLVSEPPGDEGPAGRGATLRVTDRGPPLHDPHRRRRPLGDRLAGAAAEAGRPAVDRGAASPEEALDVLRRQPCQLVIQDMNFSRRTSGEEGLALLRADQGGHAVAAGDPDHRVGIDRAGGRGDEGGRGGLRHQAVDERSRCCRPCRRRWGWLRRGRRPTSARQPRGARRALRLRRPRRPRSADAARSCS